MRARGDAGQALPLVVLMVALVGASLFGVGRLGVATTDRARAQTAADAAALAGAVDGRGAAEALARANGGRLVDFERDGGEALAVVEVGTAVARARARSGGGGEAAGSTTGLAPAMRAALARAGQLLGAPVPVTSGFRTRAQQEALWRRRHSNPYPVAQPGSSRHERGLAVDVPASFVPRLLTVARQAGLCQPYPKADPVHFELCR